MTVFPAPAATAAASIKPAQAQARAEQQQPKRKSSANVTVTRTNTNSTNSSGASTKRTGLVQRFNALCLKNGVTGTVKSSSNKKPRPFAFSSQHHIDPLRELAENHLGIVGHDPRFKSLLARYENQPFSMLLSAVRRLCATLEEENGLSPPRCLDSPPPFAVRLRRFRALLDQYGVTQAIEWYKDSHRLRYKIYMALSEIDPYFDLNEPEFNALLCNTDFGLEAVLAEIHEILALGKVAIHVNRFWSHYHDPAGCGSSADDKSPASPCRCAGAPLGSSL